MSDDKKLIDFMRAEIARTRKGVQTTYLFGFIAAVLVGGYMAFILSMVSEATDGQFLATAVRNQVEAAVPGMIDSGEVALAEKASVMANDLSQRFIAMVPELAEAGREQIDASYEDHIPYLSEEFSAIVREYIQANQAELVAFAEQHTSEEFAQEFTRQMMGEFARQIDARMRDHTDGDGLAYFNENLLNSLVAMDDKLNELLAKPVDQLDQRERLQRRVLARMVAAVAQAQAGS